MLVGCFVLGTDPKANLSILDLGVDINLNGAIDEGHVDPFTVDGGLIDHPVPGGCRSIEHIDWFHPLFVEAPELVDGQLMVPDRPGHGFTFDRAAVQRFGVG